LKKKLLFVLGTRPEGIKLSPLILECRKQETIFSTEVCTTGQHQQMLEQVLTLFGVTPDYDLAVMKAGQDLYDITARVLIGMRDVLLRSQPDMVLVHGDTVTSTTAALAAFYQKIPVAHVEAGLRTYNLHSPWPEEANRQLTSRLATLHFAPTMQAKENLTAERIDANQILVTGNTVIDALCFVSDRIDADSRLITKTGAVIRLAGYDINRLQTGRRLVLITGHRRENFGQGILNICQSIQKLAQMNPSVDFVYPVHLNPQVQQPVRSLLGSALNGNIYLIDPLDYVSFIVLMKAAYLILTDSGGIQEEAPGLGKPVLVMRDTTERPEAITAGTVALVGTEPDHIIKGVNKLLNDPEAYRLMSTAKNPYGDGTASRQIVEFLTRYDLPTRDS